MADFKYGVNRYVNIAVSVTRGGNTLHVLEVNDVHMLMYDTHLSHNVCGKTKCNKNESVDQ